MVDCWNMMEWLQLAPGDITITREAPFTAETFWPHLLAQWQEGETRRPSLFGTVKMMVLSVRLTLLNFGQMSNLEREREREREVKGQHSLPPLNHSDLVLG